MHICGKVFALSTRCASEYAPTTPAAAELGWASHRIHAPVTAPRGVESAEHDSGRAISDCFTQLESLQSFDVQTDNDAVVGTSIMHVDLINLSPTGTHPLPIVISNNCVMLQVVVSNPSKTGVKSE